METKLIKQFNSGTFTTSAFLKINNLNTPYLILKHVPVKETAEGGKGNKEIVRFGHGSIVDTRTSLDNQHTLKLGKVVGI